MTQLANWLIFLGQIKHHIYVYKILKIVFLVFLKWNVFLCDKDLSLSLYKSYTECILTKKSI